MIQKPIDVRNISDWLRYHSSGIQFYATDTELYNVLQSSLPEEFQPYTMICRYSVKTDSQYVWRCIERPFAEFLEMRKEKRDIFYLRSSKITPVLDFLKACTVSAYLPHNGLINIQQGLVSSISGWDSSFINLNYEVINRLTGEVVKHKDYKTMFLSIKRELKKILCYRTYIKLTDGSLIEEKGTLITEGFADLIRKGKIRTTAYIGPKLNRKGQGKQVGEERAIEHAKLDRGVARKFK